MHCTFIIVEILNTERYSKSILFNKHQFNAMYWVNKMIILISKMYDLSSSNVWKVLLICHVVFCCPWTLPMHTDDICSFYITVWGQFSVFYRNTQGNILHFNNSIFHVYSHSVELKLSDILLTEAHTWSIILGVL